MKWKIQFLALFFVSPICVAETIQKTDSLTASYVFRLETLMQKGIDLHKNYDLMELEGIGYCVDDRHHLRRIAKKIKEETEDMPPTIKNSGLEHPSDKTDLMRASQKVFECVYCNEDTFTTCFEAKRTLQLIKDRLANPPKVDSKPLFDE